MKCHRSQGAAVIGLVLATLTPACSSSTRGGGTATVPQTPSTADTWAVPAVIDTPYLQRVMNRLDQSLGDAFREMVAAKAVDPKVEQILSALYAGGELARTEQAFRTASSHLSQYRSSPGDPTTTVDEILTRTTRCAYFSARRSFANTVTFAPPENGTRSYVALVTSGARSSSAAINPTGWMLALDAVSPTGATPKDPCA
jgi:hypothetical protein